MAEKVKQTKTKHTGIYFNENTQKYDIKYNYTVYNPEKQKNEYKQKWKYGISSVKEAKAELLKLQNGNEADKTKDSEITLEGAYQLWRTRTENQNFSPKSFKNTSTHLKMLYQFIPKETKMQDITEEMYEKIMNDLKKHDYIEETIHNMQVPSDLQMLKKQH